jgi:nucleoside-diphosphate-sugar epimerase
LTLRGASDPSVYNPKMTVELKRIAVIGSTGPTGIHLVRELARRGRGVVAVSRRPEKLKELFAREQGVETAAADALDEGAVTAVVKGCDLVVDCVGLPAERMADHPKTARVIAGAARQAGARCLQVSSYWSFFPNQADVVSEAHPRQGGHEWFRMRRDAEDVMLSTGAAVVHIPDFFGPHVHTSSVQAALEEAASGGPVHCLGRSDTPREAAYVPDAMRIVADLAERDEAYGTDWGLPGSGPLSADRLAEIASKHLGRPVKVSAAPGWLVKILGLISPKMRAIRPIVPHYVRAVRYDTSKLRGLLGEVPTTPFEQAIPATLDSIASK